MSFWLSYVGIGFNGRAIPYFDDRTRCCSRCRS